MPICAIIFAHNVGSVQRIVETQTARTTTRNKQTNKDRTINQIWKKT